MFYKNIKLDSNKLEYQSSECVELPYYISQFDISLINNNIIIYGGKYGSYYPETINNHMWYLPLNNHANV